MKRPDRLFCRAAASSSLALACLPLIAGSARAQIVDQFVPTNIYGLNTAQGVTVTSRLHPEYDSVPITIGNTTINPSLSQAFGYDSNVTGTQHGQGSALSETQADIRATSQSVDTTVSGELSGVRTQYLSVPRQSQTNWNAMAGISHAFSEDSAGASYAHIDQAQNARSLNVPTLDSPVSNRVDDVKLYYNVALHRISVQPGLEVAYNSFDNGTSAGREFLQSILDNYAISPSATVRYNLSPQRDLLFVLRDSVIRYTTSQSQGRNANSIAALAGIDDNVDDVWRVRFLAGAENRTFQSAQFSSITTPIVSLAAIWTPTQVTTLTGSVSRHLATATQLSEASYTANEARLQIDHEALRNVILTAYVAGDLAQYPDGGGNQVLYLTGASGSWKVNRSIQLIASYDFNARNSNGTSARNNTLVNGTILAGNYSESVYMLRAKLAF